LESLSAYPHYAEISKRKISGISSSKFVRKVRKSSSWGRSFAASLSFTVSLHLAEPGPKNGLLSLSNGHPGVVFIFAMICSSKIPNKLDGICRISYEIYQAEMFHFR